MAEPPAADDVVATGKREAAMLRADAPASSVPVLALSVSRVAAAAVATAAAAVTSSTTAVAA
jgi:hypothetical protein